MSWSDELRAPESITYRPRVDARVLVALIKPIAIAVIVADIIAALLVGLR